MTRDANSNERNSALFATTIPITLEAFLVPFADHFRQRGWRVDGMANGAGGIDALVPHFDALHDAAWSRNPLSPGTLLRGARQVREVAEANRYDLVHVHTPVAAWVTREALHALPADTRPIVIYTCHGFHFYRGQSLLPRTLYRGLERKAAPWTDYLVTVNQEDCEAAQEFAGIPSDRVRLIPGIGVDPRRFGPQAASANEVDRIRTDLGITSDQFMLSMIAEFSPVKRHAMAMDAISRVSATSEVVLVLVGDGPLESQVRRLAVERGVEKRVRFAGYRRDAPQLLAASDALLICSEREGLNRSVLEAMASARPVIGTDTRGIADAIEKASGWLVPKNDTAALARAIEEAAENPEECAVRGRYARQRALSEYSLDRILHSYEELYSEALSSSLRRD